MRREAFATLAWISVFLLGADPAPEESQEPRVLRPLDRTVLAPGPVEIAVIVAPGGSAPPILLDGKRLAISSSPPSKAQEISSSPQRRDGVFLPPALVFVRSLSPGLHKLSVGETKVEFFVCDEKGNVTATSDWPRYTAHPPAGTDALTCIACHQLSKERLFVNMNTAFSLEKPTGCFDCHERSEFNLTHNHRYESLAFCQMCHDPHGATRDHLLKMPQKKACALCHE